MSAIGNTFVKKTRYESLAPSDQATGMPQPPLEIDADDSTRTINLPDPGSVQPGTVDFKRLVDSRESVRDYAATPLSLDELSFLLWCTQGVKKVHPGKATLRTVPSAGARHAFETYLLVNNVEGLSRGLFHFLAIPHKLVEMPRKEHFAQHVTAACLNQQFVRTCAVTFIWMAAVSRMTWRYGERGYRYLYLDAGHVCQNLYLAAGTIGCGVCAIGAFDDDKMNALLALDGEQQFVIYLAAVGRGK